MTYCNKGLMPNLFPEGANQPLYNTVDAGLLFIVAVYEYYQRTKKVDFVKEAYPVMKEIVSWYRRGTDFHISMDQDGLITAGGDLEQVTWMDVTGKTIAPACQEISYADLAAIVKESFCSRFWNEEKHCLKDVISGTAADEQIRCNQIWAVSMPFSILPREQEKAVAETVFRKLYTKGCFAQAWSVGEILRVYDALR